jgi:hypothetical protein
MFMLPEHRIANVIFPAGKMGAVWLYSFANCKTVSSAAHALFSSFSSPRAISKTALNFDID